MFKFNIISHRLYISNVHKSICKLHIRNFPNAFENNSIFLICTLFHIFLICFFSNFVRLSCLKFDFLDVNLVLPDVRLSLDIILKIKD